MQQFYFLIFMGEVTGGGGWVAGEQENNLWRRGGYGLSIKYHKLPSNPAQNEQFLMRESS